MAAEFEQEGNSTASELSVEAYQLNKFMQDVNAVRDRTCRQLHLAND
jgi:hypothetical protein